MGCALPPLARSESRGGDRTREKVVEYKYLLTETFDDGAIERIILNRPEARNAQNREMLVELGQAFERAEMDDKVRVVILAGAGPMFSSGHDMGSKEQLASMLPGPEQHPTARCNGGTLKAAEGRTLQEWHYFFQNTLRWRNLRKTMWACDLIVAAEETTFCDVVGTRLGMAGMEYFAHPWEFGPRKTKEMMLTGDAIDVEEAYRLQMVSKIYPKDELADRTLEFARRIAKVPTMAALMIKESVNQSVDNMGFYNALQACFTLHQLNHTHWESMHGGYAAGGRPVAFPEDGVPDWREAPPIRLAEKDR
jgi:enoyl-CoA hydratase